MTEKLNRGTAFPQEESGCYFLHEGLSDAYCKALNLGRTLGRLLEQLASPLLTLENPNDPMGDIMLFQQRQPAH